LTLDLNQQKFDESVYIYGKIRSQVEPVPPYAEYALKQVLSSYSGNRQKGRKTPIRFLRLCLTHLYTSPSYFVSSYQFHLVSTLQLGKGTENCIMHLTVLDLPDLLSYNDQHAESMTVLFNVHFCKISHNWYSFIITITSPNLTLLQLNSFQRITFHTAQKGLFRK